MSRNPAVEDRLMFAGQNLALLARLAHAEALALDAGQDLSRDSDAPSSWCLLRLSEDAYNHVQAVRAAIGDAAGLAAPDTKGRA